MIKKLSLVTILICASAASMENTDTAKNQLEQLKQEWTSQADVIFLVASKNDELSQEKIKRNPLWDKVQKFSKEDREKFFEEICLEQTYFPNNWATVRYAFAAAVYTASANKRLREKMREASPYQNDHTVSYLSCLEIG